MIRAFLFDYGGVMTASEITGGLTERLAKALDISPDEVYEALAYAWDGYVVGNITEEEVWSRVEAATGKHVAEEKRNVWNTWEQSAVLPQMRQLIQDLKNQGYIVGLLSNVIPNIMEEISRHGGYDVFNFALLSCETGFAKPDPEFYKLAFDYLPGIKPEEIVFIDDQERFLAPARKLGMRTILALNPDQVTQDIKELVCPETTSALK